MPHLKEFMGLVPNFSSLEMPPQPHRLELAKVNVTRILGNTVPREPSVYDLTETYKTLSQTPFNAEYFLRLPTKHLKRAPWVMFEPINKGESALADVPAFLSTYIECLKKRLFGPAIVALAMVFLRYYPQEKPYFSFLRERIADLLSMLMTPKGRSLYQRSQRYGLFAENGPKVFGNELVEAEDPNDLLILAGFDDNFVQRGFVKVSIEQMLRQLSSELGNARFDDVRLSKLLRFFESNREDSSGLRFPSLRGEIADSLLLPYTVVSPTASVQGLIRNFLIGNFNDPRIKRGNWHAVSEEAVAVFMRWLVHATLEDFFRVVREGSRQDRDADRMWPYREAFWSAYLHKGVISDAWVILADRIANKSREFLSTQVNAYGKFGRGSGVSSFHAALIIRIGDLIITEWNYSGKYRVWHADNQMAPRFYRSRYTKGDLIRAADIEKTHHGAESGSWQGTLVSLIAEWTGVRVTYREYMPK